MRIPTEHFGNVPVVLLSPSLLNSPTTSGTSSPCHLASNAMNHNYNNNNYHYHTLGGAGQSHYVNEMDAFPKTLMERLMRPETDQKVTDRVQTFLPPSSLSHPSRSVVFRNAGPWAAHLLRRATRSRRQTARPGRWARLSKWRACRFTRRRNRRRCCQAVPKTGRWPR